MSSTFLRLKLSRGTIIAANIGQAMVNLKLWLSKSSSSHSQLHGGRGLNSQSLVCEPHTLPLGYHAKFVVLQIQILQQHIFSKVDEIRQLESNISRTATRHATVVPILC